MAATLAGKRPGSVIGAPFLPFRLCYGTDYPPASGADATAAVRAMKAAGAAGTE
jgi:hypothetical protein